LPERIESSSVQSFWLVTVSMLVVMFSITWVRPFANLGSTYCNMVNLPLARLVIVIIQSRHFFWRLSINPNGKLSLSRLTSYPVKSLYSWLSTRGNWIGGINGCFHQIEDIFPGNLRLNQKSYRLSYFHVNTKADFGKFVYKWVPDPYYRLDRQAPVGCARGWKRI